MKKTYISLLLASAVLTAGADTLDDAAGKLMEGDYWQAQKLLEKAVAANPKVKNSPQYIYLSGACEFEAGNYERAGKLLSEAKKKGAAAANLYLGRLAFMNYDFDTASDFYGDFRAYVEKSKRPGLESVDEYERQLAVAESALGRVEDIVVIDSLALPKDTFFKSYRLPESAGSLLLPEEIPFEGNPEGRVAYMNEGKDFLMWGEPDSVGNVRLVESLRLLDGSWQTPAETSSALNRGGYADYPFMMADGVTLYYASDGNDSMGGYDIFVASRDATTGEYLQPQNIGMPFNSPYDDYMLAIDEENGVGWWATDRNLLGDKVTVYVYLINDLRKNHDADDENILGFARLSDFRATQDDSQRERYDEILDLLENIAVGEEESPDDFRFPVGGGRYYTRFEDFRKPSAKEAMRKYLASVDAMEECSRKLDSLYASYRERRSDGVRRDIVRLEGEIDGLRAKMIKLRSDVYRLENISDR